MTGAADEVVFSLTELLAIAKVAMPGHLFEIDPRVNRAQQLLATLSQVSGQPPNSLPLSTEMLEGAPASTLANVPGAAPPWDITAGLDAFMATDLAPETRTDAVIMILRDWLVGHGYIGLPPEEGQCN